VVEEFATGGAVLAVSELVRDDRVESMARPIKEEGIELSGGFIQEGYSQLSPSGALNMLTTWLVKFAKEELPAVKPNFGYSKMSTGLWGSQFEHKSMLTLANETFVSARQPRLHLLACPP
jgi:hypothetical protein